MKINKVIKDMGIEYKEKPVRYSLLFIGGFIVTKIAMYAIK